MTVQYTDDTLLMFGPHKFKRLANVPAQYLLNRAACGCQDKLLAEYIIQNQKSLFERAKTEKDVVKNATCNKIAFENMESAEKRMYEIQSEPGDHTKPKRAYWCDKCGLYHLTSKLKM